MTREEARADLMLAQADISYRPKDDSIDMAIEALENQNSIISELERLKKEIEKIPYYQLRFEVPRLINKHISELKGE